MPEVSARNLPRVQHEKRYSQEALAPEVGVDRTYIRALERGAYSANIDMPDKLAAVLGAETDMLLHRASKLGRKKPLPFRAGAYWKPHKQ
ncbi:MAG: helix-turn-helix transcriptional regulator [Bradyrhizobium sp.]